MRRLVATSVPPTAAGGGALRVRCEWGAVATQTWFPTAARG